MIIKKISFQKMNGVEVLEYNNNVKKYHNINFNNNSRPKNLIEIEFNKILLNYLLIYWSNYTIDKCGNSKIEKSVNQYNNILKKCKFLNNKLFKDQILIIINKLGKGYNFIINYRKSLKLRPKFLKNNKYIYITPIIRLWYIRIFKDKKFAATRIQTLVRIYISKMKFNKLKRITIKWLNLYFLKKKNNIIRKIYTKQYRKILNLENKFQKLKNNINKYKYNEYKYMYKNKQIQRLKYENVIMELNSIGYINYKTNKNNISTINYNKNNIIIEDKGNIITKKTKKTKKILVFKYNNLNNLLKFHKFK
jgi:hypothetical protein